jgi:prevent-host-death family protein
MSSINITNARKDLYRIVESVNLSHEPVHITGKNSSAVLIGEDDWKSIEETLYLMSLPGMRESIIKGMKTPIEELDSELDW